MTIDQEDHAPRKPDDLVAANMPSVILGFVAANTIPPEQKPRFVSLLWARVKPAHCHQLGCEFSELPQG